jgi:hypothetical protein
VLELEDALAKYHHTPCAGVVPVLTGKVRMRSYALSLERN